MNLGKTFALIALLATIWGVTYIHDRAHRYDIVVAGAGSGGTQNDAGQTDLRAFIIDHQSGRVWMSVGSLGFMGIPLMRLHCTPDQIKSSMGCSESAAEEGTKK
jgi:hypothetical protein